MVPNPTTGLVSYNVLVGDSAALTSAHELPNTVPVAHIEVVREIDRIPEATLTIVDGRVATADFEVSDSGLFAPGKHVEIKLGYDAQSQTVFKGIVVSIRHTIDLGTSRLKVVCKHEAIKMTIGKKSRHYAEMTDSDVISQLFGESGLGQVSVKNTSATHEQLLQAQVTDWDFVLSRADVNGLHCLIDNDDIAIRSIDTEDRAVVDLRYGRDIFELDAEWDARRQHTELEAYSWNYTDQEVQQLSAEAGGVPAQGILSLDELAGMAAKPYEIRSSVHLTTVEQQGIADAKRARQAMSKIKGTVQFSGNAAVKPGSFVNIEGVGTHFNGKAFVSAVIHEVADGSWFTTAVLGVDERFFAERVHPGLATSENGTISLMKGLQVGVATDLIDPKGEGRVRVRFPVIDPMDDGIYARVATLDAGDGRGTFFRPEVGDEVIVGFINGDARQPVIVGMLHSSAKPTPYEPHEDNDEKGYVSRQGVKVTIHDGDKRIVIETPDKRKVTLDDSAGVISVEDDQGNSLTMDSGGIVIKTDGDIMMDAQGKIGLSAMEMAFGANSTVTLEANAGITMDSSGTAKLKGTTVDIQGSLVKIN